MRKRADITEKVMTMTLAAENFAGAELQSSLEQKQTVPV